MFKIDKALFNCLRCLKWGGFDVSSQAMYFNKEIMQYVEVEKESYHARCFNEAEKTSELENWRVMYIINLQWVSIFLGGT